jgi:hypothetical protein
VKLSEPLARSDANVIRGLLAEMAARFGDMGALAIGDQIEQALRDLSGSVSSDALPEMAARLAIVRLEATVHAGPRSRNHHYWPTGH